MEPVREGEIRFVDKPPYLPRSAVSIIPGPVGNTDNPLLKPYYRLSTLTNVTYQLLSTTNVRGLELPLTFRLVTDRPPLDDHGLLRDRSRYEGFVTNIVFGQSCTNYLPGIPEGKPMQFSDERLKWPEMDFAIIYVTNRVLSPVEVMDTPDYRGRQLLRQRLTNPASAPSSIF